jgi:hypothetical protein
MQSRHRPEGVRLEDGQLNQCQKGERHESGKKSVKGRQGEEE